MDFAEINDPKGLAKDVTGLGRWGNGDVEVGLASVAICRMSWAWCANPWKNNGLR